MPPNAARLSDAEVATLTRTLADRVPRDASAMAASRVVDIATRAPLGLRPLPDDEPEGDTPEQEPAQRADNRPAWLSDIDFLIRCERKSASKVLGEAIGMVIAEETDDLRREVQGKLAAPALAHEIEELKLAIGALKNENQSLRLILENLRITQRGERGVDGDRGPPGRDGVQGPVGPKGERGEEASEVSQRQKSFRGIWTP
jgi:hypothetical protein